MRNKWVPTPEYVSWSAMKTRCSNPNQSCYKHYGGRGIKVCERWLVFKNFLDDMGPKPTPRHTIDRIDTNGNYEPSNCRWITQAEQTRNTRRNRILTLHGKSMTLADWALALGVEYFTLHHRVRNGWSDERILTTPVLDPMRGRPICSIPNCGRIAVGRGYCNAHYLRFMSGKLQPERPIGEQSGPYNRNWKGGISRTWKEKQKHSTAL